MTDDSAVSILTAGSHAWVGALVVDARLIVTTLAVRGALRTAVRRIANEPGQARARRRLSYSSAN